VTVVSTDLRDGRRRRAPGVVMLLDKLSLDIYLVNAPPEFDKT